MSDPLDFLFDTAMSFVQTQGRFLYKEIRDNPKYAKEFSKGRIPPELGKKAKKNVTNQLEKELSSDRFKSIAVGTIQSGIDMLVERTVTENKKGTSEKSRKLLYEVVPIAVDAALLGYSNPKEINKNVKKIVNESIKSVEEFFDNEQLLFSNGVATMLIKSEISKRISNK